MPMFVQERNKDNEGEQRKM